MMLEQKKSIIRVCKCGEFLVSESHIMMQLCETRHGLAVMLGPALLVMVRKKNKTKNMQQQNLRQVRLNLKFTRALKQENKKNPHVSILIESE